MEIDKRIVSFTHRLNGKLISAYKRNIIVEDIYKFIKEYSEKGKCLSEYEMLRLWKGLFFGMFNADMLIPQEEYADAVAELLHEFESIEQKQLFFKVGLTTFAREWQAIDGYRLDKYMLMFLRLLRNMLMFLKKKEWDLEQVKIVVNVIETEVLPADDDTNEKPLGLKIHLATILMNEIAKIGQSKIPHSIIMAFLLPFLKAYAVSTQALLVKSIEESIFMWVVVQDLPEEETCDSQGEEEKEMELDPRAGGVDVDIPVLRIDRLKLADALKELVKSKEIRKDRRKQAQRMAFKLEDSLKEDFTLLHKTKSYVNVRKAIHKSIKIESGKDSSKKRTIDELEKEINKYSSKRPSKKRKKNKKSNEKEKNKSKKHDEKEKKKAPLVPRGKRDPIAAFKNSAIKADAPAAILS